MYALLLSRIPAERPLGTDWSSITSVKKHLESQEKRAGSQDLALAETITRLGDLYFIEGHYLEAEPLYWRALEIRQKILGESHLDVAGSLKNLAELYEIQDRYAEAQRFYEWSNTVKKKAKLREHSDKLDSTQKIAQSVPRVAELRQAICEKCSRPFLDAEVCMYCTQTGFKAGEILRSAGVTVKPTGRPVNSLVDADTGRIFRLEELELTVGRHPSNTIVLQTDRCASRQHAVVFYRDGGFWIKDQGTTNGTFVNGLRITTEVALQEGDIVTIGQTLLRCDFRS